MALRKLWGTRGALVQGGAGAWGVHPEWAPRHLGGAFAIRVGYQTGAKEDAGPGGGRRAAHGGGAGEEVE